jgi:glycosyltransferase involved in cell wall biosynthesis
MYEMLKDANLILAMSKFGYNQLIKWFPLYKIHYIPHGVDTTIYRPYTTDERKILREKRGLREDDFVFLSVVANAGIRKRIPVLLEILRSVIQQHKNVYLFLFSNFDVPYWAGYDLISLIHEYNIVDNVFIPDKSTFKQPHSVQEMVDLYNMADCYISTSQGEGFALPILEGLACGLPAIVPNNSTMPELMNNGQNGWLVENVPGYIIEDHMFGIPTDQTYPLPDKYLFRKQIIHVLKNKQERLEKCKNAREFAVQNYDWSKLMPLWENLIINQMEKISLKNEIKAELQKQLQ